MALTPRGLTRPPQAHTHPTHMHTHAPARHPLGPLGPFSPRPWAGRTRVRWSRLDGVHGNGHHPRSAALHARSARALHAPPPIPTGRPQGSRRAPPPAWQCCSAQAGKGGFRGYRPQPCQDVCLCPQKGEAGGWLASPLPQSQAAAHPQAPPSLGPDTGGTGQEGGPRALPEPASLPAGPSHSPVSRVNCPSP